MFFMVVCVRKEGGLVCRDGVREGGHIKAKREVYLFVMVGA